MNLEPKKLSQISCVRWEKRLLPIIEKWLEKNEGWTISRLINQSVKKFVVDIYSTESVKITRLGGTKIDIS